MVLARVPVRTFFLCFLICRHTTYVESNEKNPKKCTTSNSSLSLFAAYTSTRSVRLCVVLVFWNALLLWLQLVLQLFKKCFVLFCSLRYVFFFFPCYCMSTQALSGTNVYIGIHMCIYIYREREISTSLNNRTEV